MGCYKNANCTDIWKVGDCMLIRSQNKLHIANVEHVTGIGINLLSIGTHRCSIDAEYASESIMLGIYDGEDRAKEVLDEIIYYNAIMKSVEVGFSVMSDEEKEKYDDMIFGCYDMPAE